MKGAPGLFCLILYHFGLLAGQVVDDLACDDKPGHGGDVGGAARHLAALGALAGGARRADAVLAAADGHIVHGGDGLLLGVDHFQVLDARLRSSVRMTRASGQTDVS